MAMRSPGLRLRQATAIKPFWSPAPVSTKS
jgi:hypothetical protein